MKHTSLPWVTTPSETWIGNEIGHTFFPVGKIDFAMSNGQFKDLDKANTDFILRAVNNHYELISVLEAVISELPDRCEHEREMGRTALAKAKGK